MAHFVPADREEQCHECDAAIRPNELLMRVTLREPTFGRMRHTRVVYCKDCGELYLESQER